MREARARQDGDVSSRRQWLAVAARRERKLGLMCPLSLHSVHLFVPFVFSSISYNTMIVVNVRSRHLPWKIYSPLSGLVINSTLSVDVLAGNTCGLPSFVFVIKLLLRRTASTKTNNKRSIHLVNRDRKQL